MIADHTRFKEIRIAAFKIGCGHRKEMGDLTALAESIQEEGLLQPIGVTDRLELVFGERRLRASGPRPMAGATGMIGSPK